MHRIRNNLSHELGKSQFGFEVFALQALMKRSIEVQTDISFSFMDYLKTFDGVKHEDLLKILTQLERWERAKNLTKSLLATRSSTNNRRRMQ